ENDRCDRGGGDRQLAACDRPRALVRVVAVVLAVAQVVEEVAGARDRAEGDEGKRRGQDLVALVELAGEEEPGEDEQVLHPLSRPERANQRRHGRERLGGDVRPWSPDGGLARPRTRSRAATRAVPPTET